MTRSLFRSPSSALSPADTATRCPSCSARIAGDALQCRFCRTWVVSTARCGRCDGIFLTRIEACSSCGATLEAAQPLSPAPVEAGRRRTWTIVAPIMFALAAGIGVALLSGHLGLWDGFALMVFVLAVAGGLALLSWHASIGLYQALPPGIWGSGSEPRDTATWTMRGRQGRGPR